MESMTPADMRAVLDGGNDGFGMGGNWISILLLFALFNGGFGYGGNRGNVATTEDLASGFNFNARSGQDERHTCRREQQQPGARKRDMPARLQEP